jgi:hypothetical protein
MAGRAFTALKEGATMISKTIFEQNDFEHFITCFYDEKCNAFLAKS